MCSNQPSKSSVTLQTAVLEQVKEFANQNIVFSVFDITKAIRNKTASGQLEIPEVEVTGRSYRFDISHAKVKSLFIELLNTGVFDPDFGLNSKFNGTYFEYSPYQVSANVPVTPVTPTTPAVTSAPVAPVSTVQTSTPVVKVKATEAEVTARVNKYLDNCAARFCQPTLKQVQSAIKRGNVSTGWTYQELQSLIENTLGFEIVEDKSSSQVIV